MKTKYVLWVSRDEAANLLRAPDCRASRMRNYEFEELLTEAFGLPEGESVGIAEICPFNGDYCAWGGHPDWTPSV